MRRLIYRFNGCGSDGDKSLWKDDERGVRAMFYRTDGGIKAAFISFDTSKFTTSLAERWMRNRIMQYNLNNQLCGLNQYETALLKAISDWSPSMRAHAQTFTSIATIKTKEINSSLDANNSIWNTSRKARERAIRQEIGSV